LTDDQTIKRVVHSYLFSISISCFHTQPATLQKLRPSQKDDAARPLASIRRRDVCTSKTNGAPRRVHAAETSSPPRFDGDGLRIFGGGQKNLSPLDYAISVLVAFATLWAEQVEFHSLHGANDPIQTAAQRVVKLKQFKEFTENLRVLMEHLRKNHPHRDPSFLRKTKEIRSGRINWKPVKELLDQSLQNIRGAYPEEDRVVVLINSLIEKVNKFEKEAELTKNTDLKRYHDLFSMKTPELVALIRASTSNERNFRAAFFKGSLEEDEEKVIFHESNALWKKMWEVAKAKDWQTKEKQQFFDWLKTRGATHEED
jgi:hypothetical protein